MTPEVEILIVDDEVNIRSAMLTILEKRGHRVRAVGSGEEAWAFLSQTPVELIITDLKMPGLSGLELLRKVKAGHPDTEVVVMTAYGSVETAVEAMKLGAYDYVTKPIEKERLPVVTEKALEKRRLAVENRRLKEDIQTKAHYARMIGDSEQMHHVYELVEQVANSEITILIVGESGTGKELVARAIHQQSSRAAGPFVTLNCGALPDNLFESELFGYERGAFTGALATKAGRFELADGGTLFLDEIGELSPKAQVDFLRVLETKEFRRLGGTKVVKVDTRIIAATNRNLEEAVKGGVFRDDLYYRLNVIPVRLPPLRHRSEDIPLLVESFLTEFTRAHQKDLMEVSPPAMRLLKLYSWPGNIRELRNVLERLVVTVSEKVIQPAHLPLEIQASREEARTVMITLGSPLEEVEREIIRRTLAEVTNHREKAAAILGISPRTLQYKIKQYGIKD
jgi:DNA-binding NtrC family response regulator